MAAAAAARAREEVLEVDGLVAVARRAPDAQAAEDTAEGVKAGVAAVKAGVEGTAEAAAMAAVEEAMAGVAVLRPRRRRWARWRSRLRHQ